MIRSAARSLVLLFSLAACSSDDLRPDAASDSRDATDTEAAVETDGSEPADSPNAPDGTGDVDSDATPIDTDTTDTDTTDTDTTDTDTTDTDTTDTDATDTTPDCAALDHCAEVTCAGDVPTCARCDDGYADPGDGSCADIDDGASAPCGLATCVDLGANAFECRASDAITGAVGGTSILETPLGPFVATAPPDAFVDDAGTAVAGDVRFIVSPAGFTGTNLTADGRALAPVVMADLRFERGLGRVLQLAPGATVTVIMPLPDESTLTEDDTLLVHSYDEPAHLWRIETTGAVVRLDPLGASTPDRGVLGMCVAKSLLNLPPLSLPWTDTCGAGKYCGDEGPPSVWFIGLAVVEARRAIHRRCSEVATRWPLM